jgi:hypothetical protein
MRRETSILVLGQPTPERCNLPRDGDVAVGVLGNKNPPRMLPSGGNGDPFWRSMPGSARLGSPYKASQRLTLGLQGFGGAVTHIQPFISWTEPFRLLVSLRHRSCEVREPAPRR